MNKKSAQKQKRYLINNGFSQAVVPPKETGKTPNPKRQNQNYLTRFSQAGLYFYKQPGVQIQAMSYVQSIFLRGNEALIIAVECQLTNSLPSIIIVGLGNKAVNEAKVRVRSAIVSMGFRIPIKRIIINLAPANIPKDSTDFDLPIASAILQASKQIKPFSKYEAVIGEVGLNGHVRAVRGIIGKLLASKRSGITVCYIPYENVDQAQLVTGLTIIPIKTLADLKNRPALKPIRNTHIAVPSSSGVALPFSGIAGQEQAKRALEIAAAGSHNVLLHGPPGSGKSLLAKAAQTILPPPSHEEVLEITHFYSLSAANFDALVTTRPCRSPHKNINKTAMIGGGQAGRPGEVTLSHCGILLLDEMPEFDRTTLEALRQPLEDKCITISHSRGSVTYPANFMLIATANPCPCGYFGSDVDCRCTPSQINRYQQRLSGPILDRIDLHIRIDPVDHASILAAAPNDDADASLRQRVVQARRIQQERQSQGKTNGSMTNGDVVKLSMDKEARELLDQAASQLHISARGYISLIKVAQTVADLEGTPCIQTQHILEALQYRSNP